MSVWFEGQSSIQCSMEQVRHALTDLGAHYVALVSLMPGLSSVELVEQGPDWVTIKTNEGLMKRTNIQVRGEGERVVVELDEEYQAGTKVTATSHFLDEFVVSEGEVIHRLVISDVEASGFLGFFYRKLGSSSIGKAFLAAYKTCLEQDAD